MALTRFLYPPDGTNIVKEVKLSTQWSVDGAGAANVLALVAGRGVTIAQSGATTSTIYTVTFDSGSVNAVLNVESAYVSAFDKTKKTCINVKSISTAGCVLQAYDATTQTVGPIDLAGTLCVTLTCSNSSVIA